MQRDPFYGKRFEAISDSYKAFNGWGESPREMLEGVVGIDRAEEGVPVKGEKVYGMHI